MILVSVVGQMAANKMRCWLLCAGRGTFPSQHIEANSALCNTWSVKGWEVSLLFLEADV